MTDYEAFHALWFEPPNRSTPCRIIRRKGDLVTVRTIDGRDLDLPADDVWEPRNYTMVSDEKEGWVWRKRNR